MDLYSQNAERFFFFIVKNDQNSIIVDYSRQILLFLNQHNRKIRGKTIEDIFSIQSHDEYSIAQIIREKASPKFDSVCTKFILSRFPLSVDSGENHEIIFLTPYIEKIEKYEQFPEVVSLQLFEQTLLSSLGDGVYIRDFKGKIVFANKRFCDIHGIDPRRIIGISSSTLLMQDSLKKSDFLKPTDFTTETPAHTYIGKVNRKDLEIWVEVNSSLLTFQGIPFAIASVVRNVSKREDLIQELKEAYLINENITAYVSHEIRGALTAIHGFSEFLLLHPEFFNDSPRIMNYLGVILSNTKRIQDITNDILTSFSLIEGHSPSLKITSLNCIELLTQCAAELSGLIEAKKIRIKIKAQNYYSPIIAVDKGKFFQVIVNLIENAIKYSHTGSSIIVSTSTNEHGSMAEISIIDEGIGIKKEDLVDIFKRFYRGSNVGQTKGTGIGLFICKKYIDQMKGEITISSEGLGKGTKVIIRIPISVNTVSQPLTDSNILI